MISFRLMTTAVVLAATVSASDAQALRPNALLAGTDTPAQRKIALAQAALPRDPKHAQAHADLALAPPH